MNKHENKKYCSYECRKKGIVIAARERREKERENSVRKCKLCSKEFKPNRHNRKYCSKECAKEQEIINEKESKKKKNKRKKEKIILERIEEIESKESSKRRKYLKEKRRKDKSYKIRQYIVSMGLDEYFSLKFERDYYFFKPCKFDKNNGNLYYIHDFNDDKDFSASLIKYTDTSLSEKEFEYYRNKGNLVFYEKLH